MSRYITLFIFLLYALVCAAQSPERLSYQSVVRDSYNELVCSGAVGLRISLLQGSIDGESVYVEEHLVRSNANGLVSLEIGGGTVVSGEFTTIDWSDGPYFLRTETDPAGGVNYGITGISQLLSVPYALHARTADSIRGGLTERDPVYASSVAGGITEADTSTWHRKQDRLIAGPGLTITGNVISLTAALPRSPRVGDFAHGGIVFWVDERGEHGLVAAKEDQSTGIRWHAGTHGVTGATGDSVYVGKVNTARIIKMYGAGDGGMYAARLCAELEVMEGGQAYADWYLPSKEELNLMYANKTLIDSVAQANGGSSFSSAWYWSSTEIYNFYAWRQDFVSGGQYDFSKTVTSRVRAVRAF